MCMSNIMDRFNPPKIEEIHKLHRMLNEARIEHEFIDRGTGVMDVDTEVKFGYQICVRDEYGRVVISVIEGFGTYGVEDDLLEIMGLLTEEEKDESVVGWLTAENVFERITRYLQSSEK